MLHSRTASPCGVCTVGATVGPSLKRSLRRTCHRCAVCSSRARDSCVSLGSSSWGKTSRTGHSWRSSTRWTSGHTLTSPLLHGPCCVSTPCVVEDVSSSQTTCCSAHSRVVKLLWMLNSICNLLEESTWFSNILICPPKKIKKIRLMFCKKHLIFAGFLKNIMLKFIYTNFTLLSHVFLLYLTFKVFIMFRYRRILLYVFNTPKTIWCKNKIKLEQMNV